MSTILDALRKLQRDREGRTGGGLFRSVTLSAPSARGGRRLVALAALLALGGGAAWLYAGDFTAVVATGVETLAAVGGSAEDGGEIAEARSEAARDEPAGLEEPRSRPPGSRAAAPSLGGPRTGGPRAEGPRVAAATPPSSPPRTRIPSRSALPPARGSRTSSGTTAARKRTDGAASEVTPPGVVVTDAAQQAMKEEIALLEARMKRAALLGERGELAVAKERLLELRPPGSEPAAKPPEQRGGRSVASTPRPTPRAAPRPAPRPPSAATARPAERQVTVVPGRGGPRPAPSPARSANPKAGTAQIIPASGPRTTGSAPSLRDDLQREPLISPPPELPPAPARHGPGEVEESWLGVSFPDIRVDSVRWHPDPARRTAKVQFEAAGPLEVREGDIVAGLLVTLIDPAAIEVQLGENRKRVPLEP